jgi:hypothetical protein
MVSSLRCQITETKEERLLLDLLRSMFIATLRKKKVNKKNKYTGPIVGYAEKKL